MKTKTGYENNRTNIIIKENYVLKYYKIDKKYYNEKKFYLEIKKHNLDFIPTLLAFNDTKKLLIIKNVGTRINKNKVDWSIIRKYFDKLVSLNYYHNDMRNPNILYDLYLNKYYIIDFEHVSHKFTDFRKNYNTYKLMGL